MGAKPLFEYKATRTQDIMIFYTTIDVLTTTDVNPVTYLYDIEKMQDNQRNTAKVRKGTADA